MINLKFLPLVMVLFLSKSGFSIYEVSFINPSAGDTIYIGDTVQFKFAMDSSFFSPTAPSFEMNLDIKTNTYKFWTTLFSIEKPKGGISTYDSAAVKHPHFVIPDSLKPFDNQPAIMLHGQKVIFRYREYSATEYKVTTTSNCCITVLRRDLSKSGEDESSSTGCGKGILLSCLIPIALSLKKHVKRIF